MNFKKIIKYTTNILAVINALLLGLNSVEGIVIPYCTQITGVIGVVIGVLSGGLIGTKVVSKKSEREIVGKGEE